MAKTPEVRQSPVSIGFKVTKVFFLSFSVGFLGAHAPAVLATSDFWDQGQWTEQLSYTPTVEYWNVDLEGWKLYVHPSVLQNREKWRKLVADLQERLAEARRILPEKIYIGLMQSTIFWIETSNP